ncbi:MAG: helix-turn-helix domain-containing protein [Oscillospiraceae bacterium]
MLDPVCIGNVIRKLREKKGLTQEQLSGLAALDRTHYSKIERGLRSPTIETVFKIALALDMKPHEIIKIIEENVEFDISK